MDVFNVILVYLLKLISLFILDKLAAKEEQLPPAARAVAKSQRMLEFPVSSGNAHRQKVIIENQNQSKNKQFIYSSI